MYRGLINSIWGNYAAAAKRQMKAAQCYAQAAQMLNVRRFCGL
jgi:hypothetical protein